MSQPHLSIIIPAYNEAKRLPLTLAEVAQYLSKVGYAYEILVVNDGSTDNTAEIVREMSATIKNLKLIDNKKNQGKGGAVRQGMLLAKGEFRLFMDADNSVTIDEIESFWQWFKQGYDIVIGSIEVAGAKIQEHAAWYRRLLGKISKLIIYLVLWIDVRDTQRGFKCFRGNTVEPIFSRQTITRWGFDFEILYIASRLGFKIKEVPVIWNNFGESKVKLSDYPTTLKELLKVRWNSLTGKYKLARQ